MKITKRQLRSLLKEVILEQAAGDDFGVSPAERDALVSAGFTANGGYRNSEGYLSPKGWLLYDPQDGDYDSWIKAAVEMNDALKQAQRALDNGDLDTSLDAWERIVSPVADRWSRYGASDTEPRDAAIDFLDENSVVDEIDLNAGNVSIKLPPGISPEGAERLIAVRVKELLGLAPGKF